MGDQASDHPPFSRLLVVSAVAGDAQRGGVTADEAPVVLSVKSVVR